VPDAAPGGTTRSISARSVAVDITTGQVEIEQFVVVEDAGRLINPMIVEGLIHGGVAQGIANAIYEEVLYDDGGNILTGSLVDYLVPKMAEIPELEIHQLETLTEASVTGAKGVGEGGTIGAPAAVLNAVSDALAPFGIGIFEMPHDARAGLSLIASRSRRTDMCVGRRAGGGGARRRPL
jgi:aerobic carbon-monoxide dehydrogenase large subunit